MPAKDVYHDAVRSALVKDGWTITHDPLRISVGQRSVYVDLGAERLLAAQKGKDKIAVEVKGFQGLSEVFDLELALGQYALYRSHLSRSEPDRRLFLAVPRDAFENLLQEAVARPVLKELAVALVVFDPEQEVIVAWTT